jgi:hypothetical protein
LRHADDDDALPAREAPAILGDDVVLPLLGLEGQHRDAIAARKRGDGGHEAIVERFEARGRRDRVAQVLLEKVAEAARRLELGHPGMQIQAVNAPDFERHVLADNGGDVGRHQTLLGGKVDDGTPSGAHRCSHRAQRHRSAALN